MARRDGRLVLEESSGELVIHGAEPGDQGEYQCEVETGSDVPLSIQHRLEILRAPTLVR